MVVKLATRALRLVPAGTVRATLCRASMMTPLAGGAAKLKLVSALAALRGATLKARLALQAPALPALLPRTFQERSTPVGRARRLVHERPLMPALASSSSPAS